MLKDKLSEKISKLFKDYLEKKFGIEFLVFSEEPPSLKYGDLSFSFPLKLAFKLKTKPFELAKKISEELNEKILPHKITPSPPGYINITFDKKDYIKNSMEYEELGEKKREKIIIEHTNINPNKAAHIGHLRNAILGDTLANFYKFLNYNVEVHNYIDNTGVQVADVVLGLIYIEKKSISFLDEVENLDYYTWDLYAKVSKLLESDKDLLKLRNEILKKIEDGIDPEAKFAGKLSEKIMMCHLKTMERLNIKYDLLPKESDILKSKLWEKAFALLKEKKSVVYEESGKRSGCWVLPLKGKEGFEDEEDPDKILVRSNGTVTYTGKDIAYQLWKFGLIKSNFKFKPFLKYSASEIVFETNIEEGEELPFGCGDLVVNVIDTRQSYLQNVVKEALNLLGYKKEAENSIHFSYEMVVLSERLAKTLGFETSKISGRKGIGVKADDLIDGLIKKAKGEILKREIEKDEEKIEKISKEIAIGALKIFMLKFGKEKVISFDFEDALNFDGDTGPYLQYALVRINSLIKKLMEVGKSIEIKKPVENLPEDLWEYFMLCENFTSKIEKSIKNTDPSIFVYYLLEIAKKFHIFYTNHPFLKEENEEIYNMRLFVLYQFKNALKKGLEILNIPIPERM